MLSGLNRLARRRDANSDLATRPLPGEPVRSLRESRDTQGLSILHDTRSGQMGRAVAGNAIVRPRPRSVRRRRPSRPRPVAVARGLHDPAAMLGDRRIDQLDAQRSEAGKRVRLVFADEAAEADDVSTDNCRQPALLSRQACPHLVLSAKSRWTFSQMSPRNEFKRWLRSHMKRRCLRLARSRCRPGARSRIRFRGKADLELVGCTLMSP